MSQLPLFWSPFLYKATQDPKTDHNQTFQFQTSSSIVSGMVLLVQKFNQLYSILENYHHHHHHHQSQPLLASLEAFQSHVSNSLNQLSLNPKPGKSKFRSFPWIQQCFELLSIINDAFAKLVVAIDYPMSKWESSCVEAHLNYSLNLLEFCNSISSSLSQFGKSKVSLVHGLSLVEKNSSPSLVLEHLKPIQIQPKGLIHKEFRFQGSGEISKERCLISKEMVIHQAVEVMEAVLFWVSGILMPGLAGDAKPYLEMRRSGGRFVDSLISGLNSSVSEAMLERNGVLKEVEEVNNAVAGLVDTIRIGKGSGGEAAEELKRRLLVFEKLVEGFGKQVDCLFNKALAGRNELLNGLRQQKK